MQASVLVFLTLASLDAQSIPEAKRAMVRVAAAADLRFALPELQAAFARTHPAIRLESTFASSGILLAQIENGAPFDLFLSADTDYPRRLVDKGLARPEDLFPFGVGRLAIWVSRNSALDVERLGARVLLDPTVHHIALANPKHAPYGRAAEQALRSLGLYDRVRDRIVLGENISQAAQFVQTGAAEIGIIALSLALAPPLREQGRFFELPRGSYPRIEQAGVVLQGARDRQAAYQFRDFLIGGQGQSVLRRNGLALAGSS